jgi:hypothetical protein
MCWLVVMPGWLSSLHLSLRNCITMCQLVVTLPFGAPPSCLPRLAVASPCRCHCLSMHQLIVTLPLIMPPSHLPQQIFASPLVMTPLALNALAGCTLPLIMPPSHLTRMVVPSPLVAATTAHCNHAAIPLFIVLLPPLQLQLHCHCRLPLCQCLAIVVYCHST